MKILTGIIIGFVLLFFVLNQLVINTYEGNVFSDSYEESKKYGYFISDYTVDKDSIQLLNRKIASPKLWIEKAQENYHILLFIGRKRVINNKFNFIIEDKNLCQSPDYSIDPDIIFHYLNCYDSLGKVCLTSYNFDVLKLVVCQGSPDEGYVRPIYVDTITYAKVGYVPPKPLKW